jgi:hypothetical protein
MTLPDPASPTVPRPRRSAESARPISTRDRGVLLAVAAGRCTLSTEPGGGLLVDGRPCADQFAARRLVRRGLVDVIPEPPGRPSTTALTAAAIALLGLPITV